MTAQSTIISIVLILIFLEVWKAIVKQIDKKIRVQLRENGFLVVFYGVGFIVAAYWWVHKP